jgi:hypothetical protein
VTLDLYRVPNRPGRRKLAKSRRLAAPGGQFSATFRGLAPGRYVLLARTTATARLAAGAASPVTVTV